ncbi:hypothetical protein FC15_GL001680 [Lapidilactobacillus concavus DSM 17758]|uniref:DUF3862 domain-containing protein n=1 Tax=Lapidilactobacillus concavus DSM 17758 TaxID=1423735 RepID=A0A0R1W1U7_9LACO|nr:DUF3862 domain-containing protein [Lapidilactobacillus concavus]KRM09465.1 hypothetical protein FC15_GL001680 [Lapidilactobacillus concavus DSM 17758]GEL13985.1 hypothetical protein LCO01nite_15340 [Lapidilactobacillus concavus]
MAKKKITGEDGKEYSVKVKKPFYKRVWFWVLAIIVIAVVGSKLGGGSSDKDDKSTAKTEEKSSKSSSSKKDDGKITRKQFDAVKLGDLMKSAEGGATIDELKKEFGNPDSTSSSTTNGVKTDIVTWTNVEGGLGANIVVSFTDGHAFSKAITGFKFNRDKKISLADFNSLADGTAYSDVVNKFGEPDGYDETLIDGSKSVMATYMSGVKGDIGANFNVTFTDDKVSGKSQTSMK